MGSTVQESGGFEREVKKRWQAGWNRWRKASGVIFDRRLPAKVKGKVYSSVVRPVMVYGLETVAITKKQVEEIEVAEVGRRMMEMELSGKRRRGRPRRKFLYVVKEDMGKVGAKETDVENRMAWRKIIRFSYPD